MRSGLFLLLWGHHSHPEGRTLTSPDPNHPRGPTVIQHVEGLGRPRKTGGEGTHIRPLAACPQTQGLCSPLASRLGPTASLGARAGRHSGPGWSSPIASIALKSPLPSTMTSSLLPQKVEAAPWGCTRPAPSGAPGLSPDPSPPTFCGMNVALRFRPHGTCPGCASPSLPARPLRVARP